MTDPAQPSATEATTIIENQEALERLAQRFDAAAERGEQPGAGSDAALIAKVWRQAAKMTREAK